MTLRAKPLVWIDGVAKENGLTYAIFSEHVRGEPRFYFPRVGVPGAWVPLHEHRVPVDEPPGYEGTLAQAKRWAALHAKAVAESDG